MYNKNEVTICIPVLNNYTGLYEMIKSIEKGTIVPDKYMILDNGGKIEKQNLNDKCFVGHPGINLGVSKSWNVFIEVTPEIRLILNDDLLFYEDTLEVFLSGANYDTISYPVGTGQVNSFSFFMLPNKVINAVGLFDATFVNYYGDNDYHRRMLLKGFDLFPVNDCNLIHTGSQTLKNYSTAEREAHHRLFRKNTADYINKWGGLPGKEVFKNPYNEVK